MIVEIYSIIVLWIVLEFFFLNMISSFHELFYFWNIVEFELMNHDLDDNEFKRTLLDLLLNLDGLNEMLF